MEALLFSPGLRLYGVYLSFRTYGVYPFPLFCQENGIHHSFFCSVTSGSGDRPRKEGSHGGGVYSFSPVSHAYSRLTIDHLYLVSGYRLSPSFPCLGLDLCSSSREVLNGVGADGVGVKFPIFPVDCSPCSCPKKNEEKRRKANKNEEKLRKTKRNKKRENPSDPIYTNPIQKPPNPRRAPHHSKEMVPLPK